MTRTRLYSNIIKNGYWRRYGSTFGYNDVWLEGAVCDDQPGKGLGDNLPFTVNRTTLKGGRINNTVKNGGSYYRAYFDDYYCDSVTASGQPLFPLITSYPQELSTTAYATSAAARTNPNHPKVDVIQNVLEIGDIPRTLKIYGETLIEKLAENYLRYQFGIQPLVKDISRLVNWTQNVNDRLDQIIELRKTGGLRKTVTLDKLSASQESTILMQSAGVTLGSGVHSVGHRVIRGHCRWLPTTDYSKYSQAEMCVMAKRAVLGLEANLSGIWEGMPWSWLIDWYTNVGDLLMQTRNIIPVTLQSVSIVRHTTTESSTDAFFGSEYTLEKAIIVKERKERYPGSVALDAHLPLLSASQMGILASLLVMKHKYVSPR